MEKQRIWLTILLNRIRKTSGMGGGKNRLDREEFEYQILIVHAT